LAAIRRREWNLNGKSSRVSLAEKVDQRRAAAKGDIVGRDKTEHHYYPAAEVGVVEKLLCKLQEEISEAKHS
jgi:hypothetical protein